MKSINKFRKNIQEHREVRRLLRDETYNLY